MADHKDRKKNLSAKVFTLNAQWTHLTSYRGWKHFRIVSQRKTEKGRDLELMAVCDRSIRFWIDQELIKGDEQWQPGWL